MMSLYRDNTQVFIIRIWREPREIEGASPEWRGSIEHVASGERHYLTNLCDILDYIAPHVVTMGVKLPFVLRFKQWLKYIRSHPSG